MAAGDAEVVEPASSTPTRRASRGTIAVAAVLLDYGGTLIDFERPDAALVHAYTRIHDELFAAGLTPPPVDSLIRDIHDRVEDDFAQHRRSGTLEEIDLVGAARNAYARLGLTVDVETLDAFLRLEQEAWWQGVRVFDDVIPALETLRARGIRIGLCSNAPYRVASLHDQLRHFGLHHLLDSVTFSAEVGVRKPHPRIFEAALTSLQTTAEQCVMVGDSLEDDVAGAQRAGLHGIFIARGAERRSLDLGRRKPDAVINSLNELPRLLTAMPEAYT